MHNGTTREGGRDVEKADTTTECQQCGEVKVCCWVEDPFIAEVYPDDENEREWWCDDCYASRLAEV